MSRKGRNATRKRMEDGIEQMMAKLDAIKKDPGQRVQFKEMLDAQATMISSTLRIRSRARSMTDGPASSSIDIMPERALSTLKSALSSMPSTDSSSAKTRRFKFRAPLWQAIPPLENRFFSQFARGLTSWFILRIIIMDCYRFIEWQKTRRGKGFGQGGKENKRNEKKCEKVF